MTSATPVTHAQLEQLSQKIKIQSQPFRRLMAEVGKTIVGQEVLVHRMLVGLLANGHLLIEGIPGYDDEARVQYAGGLTVGTPEELAE